MPWKLILLKSAGDCDICIINNAGGAKLVAEFNIREIIITADLFSNIPSWLRIIAKRLTKNGWTYDNLCEYEATYSYKEETTTYTGKGVCRYVDLDE